MSVLPDPKGDVDAELEFHLETTITELVQSGYSPESAREEAHRRFGDLERYRSELQSISRKRVAKARRAEWWFIQRQNFIYAARGLRRSPRFTVGVVLTLALGIGANATMFGVIDRLLLSPPPHVKNPDRVKRLYVQRFDFAGRPFTSETIAYPDVKDWDETSSLQSVAGYNFSRLTLGRGEDASRVSISFATASFFPVLGVQPALGRFFDETDDRLGAEGVAVLSYQFWQRRFAGDSSAIGRVLDLGRRTYTVIGIAPRDFSGLDLRAVELWLPLHASASEYGHRMDRRGYYWISAVARLRPGIEVEAVEAETTRLHRLGRKPDIDDGRYSPDVTVVAAPIVVARGPLASDESVVSRWLAGVSIVVLLIACANVANLLLARGSRRRREIAIRLALGISRRRLLAQLISEAVLLAALGGIAALALAAWGADFLRQVLLPNVSWVGSTVVNSRVLVFTAVVAVAAGLLAGLAPALQASRPQLMESLKIGARGGVFRRSKTRLALQVVQAALSLVLLVGAGLFVRSLNRVSSVDLGMSPNGVLMASIEPEAGVSGSVQLQELYRQAMERVQALPGVEKVSVATSIPMWNSWGEYFAVPGIDSLPRPTTGGPYFSAVTADHFAVLGMRILRGRGLTASDVQGAPRVTVINDAMARAIWPGQNPLGRCVIIGSPDAPCTEVVGVVADSRQQAVIEEPHWLYFVPLEQPFMEFEPVALLARTTRDPEELVLGVRHALSADVPGVRLASVRPFRDLIDPQLRAWKLGATLFSVFGLLALAVAAVGLYSLLSFNVAQRNHEIGVRTALGASRGRIVALILRQAVLISSVGIVIGLAIALGAGGAMAPLLYEVSPRDPAVLGIVTLTLLAVATLASALPAWRAARVDPNAVLKAD